MTHLRTLGAALLLPALAALAGAADTPLAAGKTKFLGSAYSTAQATDFAKYFNQVTPENAGKWGSVEATRDVMNWTELDAAYQFAKNNGCKFRFHILVWGSQQPAWIDALSTAEKLEEIKEWYAAVAARYPDLDYVEVVNEPLHAPPNGETIAFSTVKAANYSDALGGTGASGWEWVLRSFRLARQYFPGKKLVLNEYGLLNDAGSMGRYVGIVNLLKAENLVDVVSVQAHSFEIKDPSTATLTANLETLAATGLPVMVTEMDIDDTTAKPQLADYQRIFPLFWEHPSVVGITLWGFRPGMWRDSYGATLVNADGSEKPAMVWLKEYVRNNAPVITAGQSFTIAPATPNNTILGVVQATDADAGAVLRDWTVAGGTGSAAVAIDAATGALRLSDSSRLDFNANASYTVSLRVSDGIGRSVATDVTLVRGNQPVFSTQPAAVSVTKGGNATFTAAASGTPAYQWQYSRDGENFAAIAGANTASHAVSGVAYAASGYYRVVATNSSGTANSNAVRLDVVPPAVATVRADGFGAGASGGSGTGSVALTVTTAAELRAAAGASGPRVITVAGTLDIGTLDVTSQKTIQGADADAALLGTLRLGAGVGNVVIRGLTLSSAVGDSLAILGASHVLVTRCTFLDSAGQQLRIASGADLVTVSWCEFGLSSPALNPRNSVLIGTAGAESRALRVTLHHNWWTANVGQHMPLAVYGQVHLFSNLLEATASTAGTAADNQTELLAEHNLYNGVRTPLSRLQSNTALAAGRIRALGQVYADCTGNAPDAGTDKVFSPAYSYALTDAASVAASVSAGAGNNGGVGYTEPAATSASISGPAAAVKPGASLTLTASATGLTAASYQWRLDNAPLAGRTSATLTATMDSTLAGTYTVVVSPAAGDAVVSAPFVVTLGTADSGGGSSGGGSSGGGSSSGGGGGGALGWGLLCGLAGFGFARRRLLGAGGRR